MEDRFLTLKEVLNIVGCKTTTWYNLIKKGIAPKQIKPYGTNAVRWSQTEVLKWVEKSKGNNRGNND
jgi:predicted DNA-binding transcriptional regulator AlpA